VSPILAAVVVTVLLAGGLFAWWAFQAPRSDRDWAADQARPARVTFDGDRVAIQDLRDFRHTADGSDIEGYRSVEFDPADVQRVWFVLAPFANRWRGLAHGFVSFELTGDRYVSISVEARREADETYSLVGGLLRGFEKTYVVGTEEDLIGLRAVRGDTLFVYPSRAAPEQARALFVDMLRAAERLRTRPEFYNTLLDNCMTALRDHVNRLEGVSLPYGWGILLPGYSDGLALEHGLLDTELPLELARERFRVDVRAREALERDASAAEFSRAIRP
jgi:hypothetical protein